MSSSKIGDLPGPVKAGGVGAVFGTMVAGTAALFGKWQLALILAAGLAIVAAMVAAVYWVRAKKAKARSSLLGRAMPGSTPGSISKAESIAKLEALRREFEKGVQKFKDAGRSLYSTPWYVVVGEPGGGKTEAIRHSQVKLITGLQDPLQGVGGTLNMNWWFTRDAIILDTAGKKLFEEVEAGASGEWEEFLNLLKTNRKDCPINGLLLCIPADTLISDTQAQIDKKAGKIAERFEQIQRVLGVRFPVFVIITKCDLIGGFNEFFENLTDLQQNQMMGWSNPAPLNSEFDPKQVEDHLKTVRARLVRRRMRRLIEPTRNEGLDSRRVDEMDALYSLPDNIEALSPRLRQYLETVFVAGAWSQKPLFLRGIYFASSMQEGSPLDLDLANALGIGVNELPKDETRSEQRTLFLKDLFTDKVFPERGLVTRVVNVDALQRKRKMILMGSGIAATLAFMIFLWTQFSSFNTGLERHRDYFSDSVSAYAQDQKPVLLEEHSRKYVADEREVVALLESGQKLAAEKVKAPFIFKPLASLDDTLDQRRGDAYRAMIYSMAIRPAQNLARKDVFEAKQENLAKDVESGRAAETLKAIQELVRWEVGGQRPPKQRREGLENLFKYVLGPRVYGERRASLEKILSAYNAAATIDPRPWPTEGGGQGMPAVQKGIQLYIDYSRASAQRDSATKLQPLIDVQKALIALDTAEKNLWALELTPCETQEKYREQATEWRTRHKAVKEAGERLNSAIAAVKLSPGWNEVDSLASLYDKHARNVIDTGIRDLEELEGCIPPTQTGELLASRQLVTAEITRARAQANDIASSTVSKDLAALSGNLKKVPALPIRTAVAGSAKPQAGEAMAYLVRLDAYDRAERQLASAEQRNWPTSGGKVADIIREIDGQHKVLDEDLAQLAAREEPKETPAFKARASTKDVNTLLALPYARFRIVEGALKANNRSPDDWKKHISLLTESIELRKRPPLPMTAMLPADTFKREFTPEVVREAADVFTDVDARLSDKATPEQAVHIDRDRLRGSLATCKSTWDQYRQQYRTYWHQDWLDDIAFLDMPWKEFHVAVTSLRLGELDDRLAELGKRSQEALQVVGAVNEAQEMVVAVGTGFRRDRDHVLSNWRDLTSDFPTARESFLTRNADEFKRDFTLELENRLLNAYWGKLHLAAMRSLASASKVQVADIAKRLDGYMRFPLAVPGPLPDLTAAELKDARDLVRTIRAGSIRGGAKALANNDPPALDASTKALLESIRGHKMLGEPRRKWVESSSRLLDALPDARKMIVKVTWPHDHKDHDSQSEHMRILRDKRPVTIEQGRKDDSINIRANISATLDLDLVGKPLAFEFGTFVQGRPPVVDGAAVLAANSEWTVLRLLHNPRFKVTPVTDKENTYEVRVCPDNAPRGVVLLLKFDEASAAVPKTLLPKLEDWPKAPKAE